MNEAVNLGGGLYRLGGAIELDGRYAGYAPHLRGYTPSNCYVFVTQDAALLVDTGYTVHQELVLGQLRSLVNAQCPLSVFLTRASDFESISNAAAVLTEFSVTRVFSKQPAHWLIGFPPQFEPQPEAADASWPVGEIEWSSYTAGVPIDIDPARPGEGSVEPVSASLRKTSSSSWLYDPGTRTLFTGDCFGHVIRSGRNDSCVLRTGDPDPTTTADVREQLLAQFDWLAIANASAQYAGVADVFATRDIEAIAPGHGCVLAGREVVRRHLELMLAVLAEFVPAEAATV